MSRRAIKIIANIMAVLMLILFLLIAGRWDYANAAKHIKADKVKIMHNTDYFSRCLCMEKRQLCLNMQAWKLTFK